MKSMCYAGATAIPAVANFVLTPLLIKLLGTDEFARWSLIEPLLLLGTFVVLLGAQVGSLREIATGNQTGAGALGSAAWILERSVPAMGVLALPVLWALFGVSAAFGLIFAIAAEALALYTANIYRGLRRPELLIVSEGGRWVLIAGIVTAGLFLTSPWIHDVSMLLYVRGAAAFAVFFLLAPRLIGFTRANRAVAGSLIRFGVPIAISQFLQVFIFNADRYAGAAAGLPKYELAQYVVHLRIAGVLNLLLISPLQLWFPVEAMRRDPARDKAFFQSVFIALAAGLIFLNVAIILCAPLFWSLIFPTIAFDGTLFVTLTVAVSVQGLAIVTAVGILKPGRTSWNVVPPLIAAGALVVLGTLLTRTNGLVGLGFARAISLGFYLLATAAISYRITPIQISRVSLGALAAGCCGLFLLPAALHHGPSLVALNILGIVALTALAVSRHAGSLRTLLQPQDQAGYRPTRSGADDGSGNAGALGAEELDLSWNYRLTRQWKRRS